VKTDENAEIIDKEGRGGRVVEKKGEERKMFGRRWEPVFDGIFS